MRARAMETSAVRRRAPSVRWMGAAALVAELTAGVAWAAPAPVRVEVTSEALDPKHAKAVGPRVRDTAAGSLHDEHGVPIEGDATTIVAVELRPITKASERDKVIFRVTVLVDGKEVYAGQPTSCWGCDEAKLLASVRTQVAAVVEHLPERAEAAVVGEERSDEAATVEEPSGEVADGEPEMGPPRAQDRPQPAAPTLTLRNAGLGLAIPGGVMLGVGIGLVVAGTREVDDGVAVEITERNYRPPGIGVAVVGGVAVVAGVALLVTHAARKRAGERLSLSPMFERSQAGVVLRGRF